MTQLQIEHWQQPKQKQVNHFYKTHNQNVSCHKLDNIFTVQDNKKTSELSPIVAAVFIRNLTTDKGELHLLRSLFVAPQYRNNKLASQLLRYVLQNTTTNLTTICEPALLPLYLSVGFNICEAPEQSQYLTKFIQQGKVVLTKYVN